MCRRPPKLPELSRSRSPNRSDAHLLDFDAPQQSGALPSQLSTLCQALKVRVFYSIVAKRWGGQTKEEKKVAIYKHRGHAVWQCAIHILPVAAAFGLVVLNCKQYYIGGELSGAKGQDIEKLAGLQFAAKLHELLMLASLGTIIFTYIRRELVFGAGIPFGALFVGFQIDSISLLWSPEFLGIIYHKWNASEGRKFTLILIIIVSTLLGVSLGPSSANLMRPRLDYWPAGGTSFWINMTSDVLSPNLITDSPSLEHCAVDTGDAACPYGDWQLIQQEYHAFWPPLLPMGSMPLHIDIPSPFSMRAMTIFQRSSSENWNDNQGSIWGDKFTLATIPTAPIADGLAEVARLWARASAATQHQRFQWRRNVRFTTTAPQSTAYTRCYENTINSTDPAESDTLQLSFPILSAIQLKGDDIDGTVYQNGFQIDNRNTTLETIQSLLDPTLPPALTWIDDSDMLNKTNSTLLAVATFPSTTNETALMYCCSIDTRLTSGDLTTFRNEYKLVTGELPSNWENGTVETNIPKLIPSAAWARCMNPTISGSNATAFSSIASTAGMWNATLISAPYNFPIIVEGILTTMVANGLARAAYNASMLNTLKGGDADGNQWHATGWYDYMFPRHLFGKGSSIFDISPSAQATATEFEMSAFVNGYAYSYKGATQLAAIAVLLLYVLLATLHFGYSLWTGWASTSWDTLPEVAALAMNSDKTQTLHDTGAGIATVGVFEETVRVRAREGGLELVFDDTQANAFVVRRNREYG